MIEKLKGMKGSCRIDFRYASSPVVISRAFSTPDKAIIAVRELKSYGAIILKAEPSGGI
jgi:hypothetical protein